jgi:PEP-CTERM motif-containing protein
MKRACPSKLRKLFSLWLTTGVVAFLALASSADAQIITLVDNNSVAQINVGSSSGMFNWNVDGQNQLAQQWFWYRVGALGPEQAINSISAPALTTPNARTLYTSYNNGAIGVEVDYQLTGFSPGSGLSDVQETITINNRTQSLLDFHFFQYSDFDLNGTPGGDTVQLGKNLHGLFNEADQTKGSSSLSETVVTPGANHGEAGLFNTTLVKLNDANPDILNDNAGPMTGDATWAFEWDFTIAPGSSVGISKDKYLSIGVVPEPSVLALISLGLIAFGLRRRRS